MRKRCAFLTIGDATGYLIDDELSVEPLRRLGWDVESIPWTDTSGALDSFGMAVVRSTWDYHKRPEHFLAVLDGLDRKGIQILNPLPLVRWNIDKAYLAELANEGILIPPTVFLRSGDDVSVDQLRRRLSSEHLVTKPVIGASAYGVSRLGPQSAGTNHLQGPLIVQVFAESVVSRGEQSLFYFNGQFSHAVEKRAASGDFRVQEELGGSLQSFVPNGTLRAAARRVLSCLSEVPLYARVDFVRSNDGNEYWLMELELIEPSLYLRMDPEAPARFAHAIDQRG